MFGSFGNVIEVTDMILEANDLQRPSGMPKVTLEVMTDATRRTIIDFVRREHDTFTRYYETPKYGTTVCQVKYDGHMIGAVLLERIPDAAESPSDGALACLVISEAMRGEGLGSAAITAAAEALILQGCSRVIAEWVASVALYERLGFKFWKRRTITTD